MKKGTIIEGLEITDIGSNGKAIGKHEGQVIFVEKLVPGDVAKVQLYKKKKSFAEANLVEIEKKSEWRVDPRCEHFGICGGCKWQNLSYDQQLQFKQNQVEQNLKKISGIEIPKAKPIMGSEHIYEYRNKLEYTFTNNRWLTTEEIQSDGDFSDRNGLGFHIPGRFDKIIDISACHLQDSITNRIRNFTKVKALKLEIPFFDLRQQTGILRNLTVRNTSLSEVMVLLAVTELNDKVVDLLEAVKAEFKELTSINYVVNSKRNDTILDLPIVSYSGKDHIVEQVFHLKYKIGPKSFFQTNSYQTARLYKAVEEVANLQGDELVYDLYTGTGTIANYLAQKASKVIGLEYVEEAVEDARQNAISNKIENTEFFAGDMKDLLSDEFYKIHGKPNVIITDPPRAGMHEDVISKILESGADRIVYVSCNPATQARDLGLMGELYNVVSIQPVDMFPHTSHVENIALLVKK